jgi:hypothetical protein
MRQCLLKLQRVQGLQQQLVASGLQQEGARYEGFRRQALAAAGAKDWVVFVEHLEQLSALRPTQATALLFTDVVGEAPRDVPSWMYPPSQDWSGLCKVLLDSWGSTPARAASLLAREGKHVVVSVVQASHQQQGVVES